MPSFRSSTHPGVILWLGGRRRLPSILQLPRTEAAVCIYNGVRCGVLIGFDALDWAQNLAGKMAANRELFLRKAG